MGSKILIICLLMTHPGVSVGSKPSKSQSSEALQDHGIFEDLNARIPQKLPAGPLSGVVSQARGTLVIYSGDDPVAAYRLGGLSRLRVGTQTVAVDADTEEALRGRLVALRPLRSGQVPPGGDRDGDGIPNRLDLLIGAHKAVLNGARYGAGYIRISFPGGDVPRSVGVCTDVVIRALRNAGIDLQRELYRDIGRSKRSYPMVKKRNPNIDHRRVRTLLPYFKRHWKRRSAAIDDAKDPLLPGDVVFMDTMPNRSGADHIGIVSNRKGPSGKPLIINNWTHGFSTSEMDLLTFVPVTHRFRMP